jgi:hypothetical protein
MVFVLPMIFGFLGVPLNTHVNFSTPSNTYSMDNPEKGS